MSYEFLPNNTEEWPGTDAWLMAGSRGLRNCIFLENAKIPSDRAIIIACAAAAKANLEENDFLLDAIERFKHEIQEPIVVG